MLFKLSLFLIPLLNLSCMHVAEFLKPLSKSVFKAVVHGAIKGTVIYCEKSIEITSEKWQIMCKIDDITDIKYRTIKLNDFDTKFEILIDQQKGERRKTIAAPVMMVSKTRPAQVIAENSKSRLMFLVERIK